MDSLSHQLHISVTGQGRRTLVFGNGFGTVQSIWAPIVADLAADHRVITFDCAGSSGNPEVWQRARHTRLEGYAEDLLRVMDTAGADPITYIGHSFAGMVGVVAACVEPSRFERVALIGASARYLNDPEAGYVGGLISSQVDEVALAMKQDYAAWANGFSQHFMGNPDKPILAAGFATTLQSLRPDVALAVIEMILRSDRRDDCRQFAALGIPTLVLQTRADAAVPSTAASWLVQTLQARYEELDLEGHFPHMLDPDLVTRHLRAFLS